RWIFTLVDVEVFKAAAEGEVDILVRPERRDPRSQLGIMMLCFWIVIECSPLCTLPRFFRQIAVHFEVSSRSLCLRLRLAGIRGVVTRICDMSRANQMKCGQAE